MAHIYVVGDHIRLKCSFPEKEAAKAIGAYEWIPSDKAWQYPAYKAQDIIRMFPRVDYGQDVQAVLDALRTQERARKALKQQSQGEIACPYPYLYQHQKRAWFLMTNHKHFALYMGMGTGKTLTTLTAIDTLQPNRVLIVAPLALLTAAWQDDMKTWFPDMESHVIRGPKGKRHAFYRQQATGIWIINFESYRMDHELLQEIEFDMLVIDESAKLKNPTSSITKLLLKHSRLVDRRYILSGCPAPNTPFEYFCQIAFLDPAILGDNYYKFRIAYGIRSAFNEYDWSMDPAHQDKMMKEIGKVAIFIDKEDCLDLPDRMHTRRIVPWMPQQQKVYNQMLKDFIVEYNAHRIPANQVITQMMKLREITSGFCLDEQGVAVDIPTKKYTDLIELLEELGPEQAVIWAHFRYEIEQIKLRLGDRATSYYGATKPKDRDGNLEAFLSGEKQYMIAHPASIGHGVTMVNTRTCIYFSQSHSYELMAQSAERIYRIGQNRKCQYFYLLVEDSIDCKILEAVQGKQTVSDALLDMLK